MIKPPIGLTPRFVRDEQRRIEIQAAVVRYMDAGYAVPPEWITEYNALIRREEDAE
jgi:hypothetical protein